MAFSRIPSLRFGTAERDEIKLLRKQGITITHRVVLLQGGGNVLDDQDGDGDSGVGIDPGADTEVEDEGQEHDDGVPSILAGPAHVQVSVNGGDHAVNSAVAFV
jgi:hypothetical protein